MLKRLVFPALGFPATAIVNWRGPAAGIGGAELMVGTRGCALIDKIEAREEWLVDYDYGDHASFPASQREVIVPNSNLKGIAQRGTPDH